MERRRRVGWEMGHVVTLESTKCNLRTHSSTHLIHITQVPTLVLDLITLCSGSLVAPRNRTGPACALTVVVPPVGDPLLDAPARTPPLRLPPLPSWSPLAARLFVSLCPSSPFALYRPQHVARGVLRSAVSGAAVRERHSCRPPRQLAGLGVLSVPAGGSRHRASVSNPLCTSPCYRFCQWPNPRRADSRQWRHRRCGW